MAWALPQGSVLGILGAQPAFERAHPQLAAEFGHEIAAEISAAMLFDSLDAWDSTQVLAPGGRRVLVFEPEYAGPWFDTRVPESFALQPQVEGDLGLRTHAFLAGELEDGAERVVLLRSDVPTLDPSIVVSAFLCLEGRDVVIGPATSGGYYLIGCRRSAPAIFDGIDWESSHVLAQTIDRLRDTRLSLAIMPPWYTVDSPDAWRMFAGHIRALRRANVDVGLPRIDDLLARLHHGC